MTIYLQHADDSQWLCSENEELLYKIEMPYVPRVGDYIALTDTQITEWYKRIAKDRKGTEDIFLSVIDENGHLIDCYGNDMGTVEEVDKFDLVGDVEDVTYDCGRGIIICRIGNSIKAPDWVTSYFEKYMELPIVQ